MLIWSSFLILHDETICWILKRTSRTSICSSDGGIDVQFWSLIQNFFLQNENLRNADWNQWFANIIFLCRVKVMKYLYVPCVEDASYPTRQKGQKCIPFSPIILNINLRLWWGNWRAIFKLNSKLLYAKWESEKCRLKSMICKSFSGEGQRLWNTCTYHVFKMRHIQQGKKGKNAFPTFK